jgi:hypothetical protein
MSTPQAAIGRPQVSEYAPYYDRYISLVPDGDILEILRKQAESTAGLLSGLREEQGELRYAPDRWSVKELIGHIIDTERMFAYRALRFARNDATPLQGFEQEDYVGNAPHARCRMADLAEELGVVRRSTICLLRSLDQDAWLRRGAANANEISVRALAYVAAGHELHHIRILRERYLRA